MNLKQKTSIFQNKMHTNNLNIKNWFHLVNSKPWRTFLYIKRYTWLNNVCKVVP